MIDDPVRAFETHIYLEGESSYGNVRNYRIVGDADSMTFGIYFSNFCAAISRSLVAADIIAHRMAHMQHRWSAIIQVTPELCDHWRHNGLPSILPTHLTPTPTTSHGTAIGLDVPLGVRERVALE